MKAVNSKLIFFISINDSKENSSLFPLAVSHQHRRYCIHRYVCVYLYVAQGHCSINRQLPCGWTNDCQNGVQFHWDD